MEPPRGPATLHDVAREAGVSLATASRSLNGSARRVNEEYRSRVVAAAERLGYIPNFSAQATVKGTSPTVALVVSDIADPYFSAIAAGVARGADENGLLVTMAVTGRSPAREVRVVRSLRGQRPQILVLCGSRFADSAEEEILARELEGYEAAGGRVVVVSQASLPFDTLEFRNYEGARDLADALVGQGNRRFAVIAGSVTLLTSVDRVRGFRDRLAEHGIELPENLVLPCDFTRDGGYAAAGHLLERGIADVDVVFAVNDVLAVGALARFREAGLDVPDDLGVAGFDGIASFQDFSPTLTTVRLPLEEAGRVATALALREHDSEPRHIHSVSGEVLIGASSR